MAVFWRGPVKATLETSPFPSGKLEEKENTARAFQVGNVETPPGQLATLMESRPACGPVARPGLRVRCDSSPLARLRRGLLRVGMWECGTRGVIMGISSPLRKPLRVRWTECCRSLSHTGLHPGSRHPEPGGLHFSFFFLLISFWENCFLRVTSDQFSFSSN